MSSLEAERQEAHRLKSAFLASMGHDLRTPLNAIIGFADLMAKGKLGPVSDEHKEYLGDILSSSRQLLQDLDGVIDFGKIESAERESCPGPLNLRGVVTEVCEILHGFAASKRIHVAIEMAPPVVDVMLDASKVEHVLYGYLAHALKCTSEGGAVTVRVLAEGEDGFRLEVEDSGGDAATAARDVGTAGRALADGIVGAEGGRVGVRREPGSGSTSWAVLARSGRPQHVG